MALIAPAVNKLPLCVVPVTLNEVSVPTEVMFGCALVYTVPATAALATCPVILPAGIEVNNEPLPTM